MDEKSDWCDSALVKKSLAIPILLQEELCSVTQLNLTAQKALELSNFLLKASLKNTGDHSAYWLTEDGKLKNQTSDFVQRR